MGDLYPNEPLIYERVDDVVYARYQNKPEVPRWIIGGDPEAVNKAQGCLFDYADWRDMMEVAKTNNTLQEQMKKTVMLYYLIKDDKNDLS